MNKTTSILLVDDDEDDRAMFIEVIQEMSCIYNYAEAQNGIEALQLLNTLEDLPDVIFLDLNMPKMSGKQCLHLLKQSERLKDIRVIIYTTSTAAEDEEEIKELGAEQLLNKPESMKELKEKLEQCFSEGSNNQNNLSSISALDY